MSYQDQTGRWEAVASALRFVRGLQAQGYSLEQSVAAMERYARRVLAEEERELRSYPIAEVVDEILAELVAASGGQRHQDDSGVPEKGARP